MRRHRFTGGGREAATVTVASGTVTVAISTCCGNCNPRQPWVATNAARDICYAKRAANCSNAVWPRYAERDKCNALAPEWFTKRTLSWYHSVLPSSTTTCAQRTPFEPWVNGSHALRFQQERSVSPNACSTGGLHKHCTNRTGVSCAPSNPHVAEAHGRSRNTYLFLHTGFYFLTLVFTLLIWLIGYIAQRINERSIT